MNTIRPLPRCTAAFIIAGFAAVFLSGCMTQERRTGRVENRQDRIDRRTEGRQDRWAIRAERQDARTQRRFDSW